MTNLRYFINLSFLHSNLIYLMSKKELHDRYSGQFLGKVWTYFHPISIMLVYVVIFKYVIVSKLKIDGGMPLDYAVYILAGLIPWFTITEVLGKSCSLIIKHTSLVKQVVFPLEILVMKSVMSSLYIQLVMILFLIIYSVVFNGIFLKTLIVLPLLIIIETVFLTGISLLLAALGVYFRDLKDFVQLFMVVGVYMAPILYLPAWVPEKIKPLMYLNPFSYFIWCFQDVLCFGAVQHPWSWCFVLIASFGVFFLGLNLFIRLKPYFGSAL